MTKKNNIFLYLICTYVLLLPLATKNFIKNKNINLGDTILGIVFLLYLLGILFNKDMRNRFLTGVKNFFREPITIFAIILILNMIVSIFYAKDRRIAITETVRFITYIAMYFIIKYEIHKDNVKSILKCYLISVIGVCVFGIIQKYTGIGLNEKFIVDYGYGQVIKIHSTFLNPNSLGAFLILAICPLITLIFTNKNKIIYIIMSALVIINIFMTDSRNAFIGLAIGLVILAIIYNKKILGFLFVGGFGALFIPKIKHRILDIFNKSQNESRIKLWKTALAMIKEHPFSGVGNGNYVVRYDEYVNKYPELKYAEYHNFPTHNSYLKIQSELGIIGITSFVGLLVCSVIKVNNFIKRENDKFLKAFYIGFLASMVAFLVMNFFDNMFFIPQIAMAYWVIVAASDKKSEEYFN